MGIAYTTNQRVPYMDPSTPFADVQLVTQQLADLLDAAMSRAGYTPPDATTFAALAARVTAVETVKPWTALTSSTALLASWATPRVRQEGPDVYRLQAALSGPMSAGATVLTVPPTFRPTKPQALPAAIINGASWGQLNTDGTLLAGSTVAAGAFLIISGTYSLT